MQLFMLGLKPGDYDDNDLEIWECNWQSYEAFDAMSTQWNVGMAGRIGMNYLALYGWLDKLEVSNDRWREILHDVRIMENEVLSLVHSPT